VAERLLVRFWMDAYKNAAKTAAAGLPVFDTVPWVEIRVPGETDSISGPVHRMDPDPRARFPEAWAAFQRDEKSEGMTGTPLTVVPWLEKGDVETLRYAGVKTLEQLAGLSDGVLGNIPGALSLRQKARDMTRAASDAAPLQAMSEELQKRDAEIASLKAQVAEILEVKRRGRPPKNAEE
jgi:hypothetical protein